MKNEYKYITRQGLPVIFIKKEQFTKTYCGIGCKYGGSNNTFKYQSKVYHLPYGVAHFIEHKLFQMPDDSDAFLQFNKLSAIANAYTATDKTVYYFTTNVAFPYEALKLLLEMYFTNVFKEEDIEKEKEIIKNEILMYEDNIGYYISQKGINHLYPKDDYSYPIIGDIESVESISSNDLNLAYKAFYTPKNSILTIVGNFNEKELFTFIENVMSTLSFYNSSPIKEKTIVSRKPLKPMEITSKILQDEVVILLRLDSITNKDAISCEKILGVLESILNVSSAFYQSLYHRKLFINDLDYQVVTYVEGSYITISAPSNKPRVLAKEIIKKIQNLTEDDIHSLWIDLYLKHLKAKSIVSLDNIDSLGDTILTLALEDIEYSSVLNKILSLTLNDFKEMIPIIKNSSITYLIFKKENKKSLI